MENIPVEIVKNIALDLIPGVLALVCKDLDIYDEAWYYEYLISKYDESEIIGREFSFKELCQRSLLEGPLCVYKSPIFINLGINGIKSHRLSYYTLECANYILKFNGDLFIINNMAKELVDINVIDINRNCYIKQSELCFLVNYNYETIIFYPPKSRILNVQCINIKQYQFYTRDTIYFYDEQVRSYNIKDKIIKAYTVERVKYGEMPNMITYILTDKQQVLIYFDKKINEEGQVINNVDDLGNNYISINKKYYYIDVYDYNFNFDFYQFQTLKYNFGYYHMHAQLVSDKKVMWITSEGNIIKTLEADSTIKKLFGAHNNLYGIKY